MPQQNAEISIGIWNDNLGEAAGTLYAAEYGGTVEEHITRFRSTYDHPFQKGRELRLAAMQGTELVGVQSLVYWPYKRGGRIYNVLQSGNSIVSPNCRGMGLFGRMLKAQDEFLRRRNEVDFLIGFPVDASLGSFIRNGWLPLDALVWRLAIINPVRLVFPREPNEIIDRLTVYGGSDELLDCDVDKFRIASCPQFVEWRSSFRSGRELVVNIPVKNHQLTFRIKIEKRRNIPIAVIGDIVATTEGESYIKKAFADMFALLRESGVGLAIVCYNEKLNININRVIESFFFLKTNKRVHAVLKPLLQDADYIAKSESWILYRGDVDTW